MDDYYCVEETSDREVIDSRFSLIDISINYLLILLSFDQ